MEIISLIRSIVSYLLIGLVFWYLPGEAVLAFSKRSFTGWTRVVSALWIGIAIFIGVSYGAALLSARWVVLPFTLILAGLGTAYCWKNRMSIGRDWGGPHWFLVPFAFLFSLSVLTSGWMKNGTLVLKGVNGVDGIWNLALSEELIHTFPPQHPAIAGIPLRGYHLLYNIFTADVSRLTGLSPVGIHFHFFPIVLSILLVYGIYIFSLRLTGSPRHSLWATFFALAGGSFSYVLVMFWGKSVSLDDALGITQPFSLLVSPSFVLSLTSLIYTWIFLDDYRRRPSIVWAIVVGALAGLAVGMKVYAGIIILPTIGWFVLWRMATKRDIGSTAVFVTCAIVSAMVFLPLNASYGFLRYQPLWPPHRVMQGVLDFTQWELKRQTLESMGATRGLFKLEVIALVIFIFGNLGTRLIGLIGLYTIRKKDISILISLLIIGSLISFILPMFFLQPIGAFNMIQFFWYFLVFVGILAGWGWSRLIQHAPRRRQVILSMIILAATLPSASEKISMLFTGQSNGISSGELEFSRELRRAGNPGDMVLVVPQIDRYSQGDIQDWFYRTGPVIPAITGKRTFLGNEVVQVA